MGDQDSTRDEATSAESDGDESSVRGTIRAAQVVYGNVEEEQSPRRISSFQTVCLTEEDGLTWDFVREEIEPFIRYDPRGGCPDAALPPEYVFFPTSLASSRIVVGCISPAMTQTDRFGRPKVLFAHLLVFDRAQFREAFDNNPFCVIDNFRFFRNFQEVLKSPDGAPQGCSNLPSRELRVDSAVAEKSSKVFDQLQQRSEDLLLLLLLASSASRPKGRPVLELIFPPQQNSLEPIVLDFLRDLFRWIPRSQRAHCSFTTLFAARERKQRTSGLWANGVEGKECLDQPGVKRFDLDVCRFRDREFAVQSFYENWLSQVYQDRQGALPPHDEMQAAAILQDRCLPSEPGLTDSEEISDDLFHEFLTINRKPLERLLLKKFQKPPREPLAPELAKLAMNWIEKSDAKALRCVSRKFSSQQVCEWLLPKYEGASRAPSRAELDAVIACTDAPVPDSGADFAGQLRLICHCWGKDLEEVALSVTRLTPDDHQHVANWAMKTVERFEAGASAELNETRTCLWFICKVDQAPWLIPALAGQVVRKEGLVDCTSGASDGPHSGAAIWSRVLSAIAARLLSQRSADRMGNANPYSGAFRPIHCLPQVGVALEQVQWLRSKQVDSIGWSNNVTEMQWNAVKLVVECEPEADSPAYVYRCVGNLGIVVAIVRSLSAYGGSNGFFAHALLIDYETFKECFDNNPFWIFSLGKFAEPAVDWKSRRAGGYHLDPYSLRAGERTIPEGLTLKALSRVAAVPGLLEWWLNLEHEQRRLDLVGSNEEVQPLLEALYFLLPPSVRLRCDFHSRCVKAEVQGSGANSSAVEFWVSGVPRERSKHPGRLTLTLGSLAKSTLETSELLRMLNTWIGQRPEWKPSQETLNVLLDLLNEASVGCAPNEWHLLHAMYARLQGQSHGDLGWDDLAKSAFKLDLTWFERLARWCLATLKPDSFRVVAWHAEIHESDFRFGPEIELRDCGESGSEAGQVLAALGNYEFVFGENKLKRVYADLTRRFQQLAVLWKLLAESAG